MIVDEEELSFSNNSEFLENCTQIGMCLSQADVDEWLASDSNDVRREHLDDAEIVQLVLGESEDDNTRSDDEECEPPATHKSAMEMLNSCITWLQIQPEATAYNISVLISL